VVVIGANTTAFDATDFEQLGKFFDELPPPIDHVLVTGPGPYYAPLATGNQRRDRDLDKSMDQGSIPLSDSS
jgi:hypothetical protein